MGYEAAIEFLELFDFEIKLLFLTIIKFFVFIKRFRHGKNCLLDTINSNFFLWYGKGKIKCHV